MVANLRMLDENLPTFLLSQSSDKPKQNSTLLYSQYGTDFEPAYALRHLDPEQHASRNRYAVAIYDAYNLDVLFGEVLLIPEWTQPSLSADQIRANGGVPPPPEPILPSEFAIQLYNPDQQITVRHKPASLTSAASWEFELPQQTFRAPSASALDRSQDDPAAVEHTPKIILKWKKDGKLSKDLACYLCGKTYHADGSRKKQKEPNITLALFKNLKEVTLYEPNMARVDIEDLKGFEVMLLLGAMVIRDVYFGSVKDVFNISPAMRRASQTTSPIIASTATLSQGNPSRPPMLSTNIPVAPSRVPPTDARTQWELDAETERLRREAAEEHRRRKKQEEQEQKQIRKMLEAEERENRQRQAAVDKETERLRRLYGKEDSHARPDVRARPERHAHSTSPRLDVQDPYPTSWGTYSTSDSYMSSAGSQSALLQPSNPSSQRLKPKSSIFGFRRHSEQDTSKLQKKKSSVW